MTPVRLEPATPQSQDKYSTTEPLRLPSKRLLSLYGDILCEYEYFVSMNRFSGHNLK